MYRQLTTVSVVFILFFHLFHTTSGADDCFSNINEFNEAFCVCAASSDVICQIANVSSDHEFWNRFSDITGYPGAITVSVLRSEVSYFPTNLFLNLPLTVREIRLKSWSFESIPRVPVAEISTNKSSLKLLEISGDESLTEISPFAFTSINSLQTLILSSNSLSKLSTDSFYNLTKLINLNLNQNKFLALPDKIFESLYQLSNLTLAQNQIASLRRDTFIGLSSVQELELHRNELLIIKNDTFREMGKLRTLDLSRNHIDTLEQAAFRGLVALESLDLSGNQLRYLPNGVFKYSDYFFNLDLKNNQLTKLDFDLFKQLPKIAFLKDNPWICDCSLFIHIEKVVEWNKETKCDYSVDFNEHYKPVKAVPKLFAEYANETAKNPAKAEKCKDLQKTIEKRSHKIAANYNAKFKKSSSNRLMPFMSFVFLMLLLPRLGI